MNNKVNNKISYFTIIFLSSILGGYFSEFSKYIFDLVIISIVIITFFKKKSFKIIYIEKNLFLNIFLIIFLILASIINLKNLNSLIFIIRLILIIVATVQILRVNGLEEVRLFYKNFIYIIFVLNIIGIFEIINKDNFYYKFLVGNFNGWFTGIGDDNYRAFSIFTHPIIYANILNLAFVINLVNIKQYKKSFNFISLSLILINIYFTKSRGAWLTLFAILIIYFFSNINLKFKISKKRFLGIYITTLILVIIFLIFNDNIIYVYNQILQRLNTLGGNDISTSQRISVIKNIVYYTKNDINIILFGNGIDTASEFMEKYTSVIQGFKAMDNQYLTLYYEVGGIFIIIFLIYIFGLIFSVVNEKSLFKKTNILCLLTIFFNMITYDAFGWKVMMFLIVVINTFSMIKYSIKKGGSICH
ncbi:O-antigen ligase family protein [Clostridium perfringens]|uniref:O-antigen ligase family protein n=1 Tax=Clostridium perfringens TaxID=1502 RepID=UPI0039E88954